MSLNLGSWLKDKTVQAEPISEQSASHNEAATPVIDETPSSTSPKAAAIAKLRPYLSQNLQRLNDDEIIALVNADVLRAWIQARNRVGGL